MTCDQSVIPPFASKNREKEGLPPAWVPQDALRYLAHTEAGLPIRMLARRAGCHASTVLRQIRRLENRRDDILVDEALRRLGQLHFPPVVPQDAASGTAGRPSRKQQTEDISMQIDAVPSGTTQGPLPVAPPSTEMLRTEARRVLRRLAEPGAVLAVAADMDKAVVVREDTAGAATRTAVVDSAVAQAMALKEWISCDMPGRVSRYRITGTGRAALAGLLADAENHARQGLAEDPAGFAGTGQSGHAPSTPRRRMRYCAVETPLLALARRRDKTGQPFLADELVTAGERLREDFELSQMGPKLAQNWEGFLTGGVQGGRMTGDSMAQGPAAARARVTSALRDLGPGLADVALRCCCYLEGLETAERRMGWSARSGKIVLRIALQRLRRHYDGLGQAGGMIG
ncbi:MAG: DUF6456 domain-containing protein [Rhodobacterales bacterium]